MALLRNASLCISLKVPSVCQGISSFRPTRPATSPWASASVSAHPASPPAIPFTCATRELCHKAVILIEYARLLPLLSCHVRRLHPLRGARGLRARVSGACAQSGTVPSGIISNLQPGVHRSCVAQARLIYASPLLSSWWSADFLRCEQAPAVLQACCATGARLRSWLHTAAADASTPSCWQGQQMHCLMAPAFNVTDLVSLEQSAEKRCCTPFTARAFQLCALVVLMLESKI